jgi:hypothetical protein
MSEFVMALARLKAIAPVPVWQEFLAGIGKLVDFEIVRFARKPPDQTTTGEILAWMQGRGSLSYELSAIAEFCTDMARAIEEEKEKRAAALLKAQDQIRSQT